MYIYFLFFLFLILIFMNNVVQDEAKDENVFKIFAPTGLLQRRLQN